MGFLSIASFCCTPIPCFCAVCERLETTGARDSPSRCLRLPRVSIQYGAHVLGRPGTPPWRPPNRSFFQLLPATDIPATGYPSRSSPSQAASRKPQELAKGETARANQRPCGSHNGRPRRYRPFACSAIPSHSPLIGSGQLVYGATNRWAAPPGWLCTFFFPSVLWWCRGSPSSSPHSKGIRLGCAMNAQSQTNWEHSVHVPTRGLLDTDASHDSCRVA